MSAENLACVPNNGVDIGLREHRSEGGHCSSADLHHRALLIVIETRFNATKRGAQAASPIGPVARRTTSPKYVGSCSQLSVGIGGKGELFSAPGEGKDSGDQQG